jgi:putative DNA primase/helicase
MDLMERFDNMVAIVEEKQDWWVMNSRGTFVFKHHIMTSHIKQNFTVIRYGDESGILYYYDTDEGFYKMDNNLRLLNQTIRQLDETLTIQQVKEVAIAVYESSKIVKQWHRTHIPVKNGLWDIEQKKLVPFSANVYIDYKIDINYNPLAHSEFIDQTLNKLSNHHVPTRRNLEECLGSIVSPELLTRFIWFLFGRTAHNGKSFFGYLIQQLVGQEYVSTLSPHDVARSQFKIAEMYGKKVNYVDETGEKSIPDFDKIKILATGGQTTVEFKGRNGFTVKLEVPQVWCSNFFPNIREEGNQVDRRLEIIPFDWNFKNDSERLADHLAEKMASTDESREYLLKLAIEGMYRLIENNGDPSPNDKRNEQKQEFKDNNDKLGEWLDTYPLIATKQGCYNHIDLNSANEIYGDYIQWCSDNEEKFPYGKPRFNNELMKRFNLKRTKKRLLDMGTGKEIGNPVQRYVINE